MLRGIDSVRAVAQQRETAPDDGVTDFADRHRARHRARPSQPDQLVGVAEVVDRGAAVDAVDAVPQRQGLGVAQHMSDATAHDEPVPDRAVLGADPRRRLRQS